MSNGAYKINFTATEQRLIEELQKRNDLLHYRTAYDLYAVLDRTERYSEKTDAAEKIRQYFSEKYSASIMTVNGGYLALRRWSPSRQSQLFSLPPTGIIPGSVSVGWNAGRDFGRREKHLKDHFKDAHTNRRLQRRQRASLTEFHVSDYFKTHYPEFWRPASNADDPEHGARDDFSLEVESVPGRKIILPFDVKSLTDADEDDDKDERERSGVVRWMHEEIIYLFADWDECQNQAVMYGFDSGVYLRDFGIKNKDLMLVKTRSLIPIDVLLVLLNIAKREPFGKMVRAIQAAALDSRPIGISPKRSQAA